MLDYLISKIENKSVSTDDFKSTLLSLAESQNDPSLEDFTRLIKQIHNFQDTQPLEDKILFIKLLELIFNCLQDSTDRDLGMVTFMDEMKIATKEVDIPYSLSSFYPNYQTKVSTCLNQLCSNDPDTNDIFDMELLTKIGRELQFLALISPRKIVSSLVLKIYNNPEVSKQCVILLSFIRKVILSEWTDTDENSESKQKNKYPLIIFQLRRFLFESFQNKLSPSMLTSEGYINTINTFSKLCSCFYTGNVENERKESLIDVNLVCNAVLLPMAFNESLIKLAFSILTKFIELSNLNLLSFQWQNISPEKEDEYKFKVEGIVALAIHHIPYLSRKENSDGLFLIISTLDKLADKLSNDKFEFSKLVILHQTTKLNSFNWIISYVIMKIFKNLWYIEKLVVPRCFLNILDEDSLLKYRFIYTDEIQDSLCIFIESILEMAVLSEFCAEDFLENNTFKKFFDTNLFRTTIARSLYYPYENHKIQTGMYFKNILNIFMKKFNLYPLPNSINYHLDPSDDNLVINYHTRSILKQFITSIYFTATYLPKLFPEEYKEIEDICGKDIKTTYFNMLLENSLYLEKRLMDEFVGKSAIKDVSAKCFIIMSCEINSYINQLNSLLKFGVDENDMLFKTITKKIVELNELAYDIKVNNSL
uniref:SpoU_methylase domain-containing protein n=1 Tax=Parastrongyloides trichosuri TaxID=131310 RepID=A0A0N4ZKR0_PARTI